MPQLNPSPWFLILVFTWLVFLYFLPPKVLGHKYPNDPNPTTAEKPKTASWAWPWN
uniref:ATP synthase complex subunit 8 n=1 Tax=Lethrinus obsoletus TaxID=182659 RepID=A4QIR8_LETOB|nr:ATP synthase F0 subunit 8 [Lethrinus obsoletus]BAF51781.1 ATPase subunit 8 [Lethrinus obsoletus]BAQ20894.1 ATPase subunit 8 [Lethrinus obsoletus]